MLTGKRMEEKIPETPNERGHTNPKHNAAPKGGHTPVTWVLRRTHGAVSENQLEQHTT